MTMLERGSMHRLAGAVVIAAMLASGGGLSAFAADAKQRHFVSPDDAVTALIEAAKAGDKPALLAILGQDGKTLISSGDETADRLGRERFLQSYQEANRLAKDGDAKATLSVGKDAWPFPIPLVKSAAGWRFDTAAGKEEILNRRIGENELDVIQVCLAYVDAQREYYLRNPSGGSLLEYAQKFASAAGKRDGLHWEAKPGEEPSPLGSLVTAARRAGYAAGKPGAAPIPYHGYYYRILTAQGKDAPGGAYDYLARGHMIGGFALVAYPAQYASSGVMTFIVNHDGVVYQKDLGSNTPAIAQAMTRFNPDSTWKKVEPAPGA
jgi:Protein of unknown function (DUF2950)